MRAASARGGPAAWLAKKSAYPRTDTHLTQQTLSGAVLSVSGVVLALCLLTSELREFARVHSTKRLGVDTLRGQAELPVLLNITFPALPCAVLDLEALDLAGAHEWDGVTAGVITKTRLDARGTKIGVYEAPAVPELFSFFGSNAQLLRLSGILQLAGPEAMRDMQEAIAAHEGCELHGKLPVPRVAGNFHLSVHAQSFYVLRQMNDGAPQLNISHSIHKLSFGPEFPGAVNPLDGFVRTTSQADLSGTYKYFLKLVPTQFRRLDGHVFNTHQYSVTEYFTTAKARAANENILPAVFFSYDFSPVTLTIEQQRRPLLHFLTRVCAVVGGVFAICGMLAKLL